jgi:DNA-binding transcriptional LysR family regulator
MVIFYNVVQQGSFSQAADALGVSKSFISKHITKLEKDLKTRLLNRTTRQLSLTEGGEIFYQHCQSLSNVAEEGYDAIVNLRKLPSGTLKISAPPTVAMHLLVKPLLEYAQRYPEVKFNVILESRIVDIIQEGYDLVLRCALRTPVLPDSTLISQKIVSLRNFLCASPGYLKKHAALKSPEQLAQHVFAIYSGNKSAKKLTLTRENKKTTINIDTYFQSNNLDILAEMIQAHSCMGVLPEFMIKNLLLKKKLVECLPEFKLPESPLYVIYPERELVPLKVKLFIDILKKHLAE